MKLKLQGVGIASATPTTAKISLQTETIASTTKIARDQHLKKIDGINSALREVGIKGDNIKSSRFEYGPNYVFNNDTDANEIKGFKAESSVEVEFTNIEVIPNLLDKLIAAGVTNIAGPTWDVKERRPLEDEARQSAYKDAMVKAQLYAKSAGVTNILCTEITEPLQYGYHGGGKMNSNAPQSAGDNETSLIGKIEVRINLDCVFDIY